MQILGVRVDQLVREEALVAIERQLLEPKESPYIITTLNAECLVLAADNPAYRETVNRSSLNLPDGMGIVWAARLRGVKRLERIAGADLIYDVARLCQDHCRRLFLLGATTNALSAGITRLRRLYPGLEVNGYSPPPFTTHRLPAEEEQAVLERIASFSPHVLCVAFGMPRQELWIAEYRDRLADLGVSLAVGVGGAVDYVAGVVPRAPQALQRLGLEWLFRLLRQPWRLRRQMAIPLFVWLVVKERLRAERT